MRWLRVLLTGVSAVVATAALGFGSAHAAVPDGPAPLPAATTSAAPTASPSATLTPSASPVPSPAPTDDRWLQLAMAAGVGLLGTVLLLFAIGAILRFRRKRKRRRAGL